MSFAFILIHLAKRSDRIFLFTKKLRVPTIHPKKEQANFLFPFSDTGNARGPEFSVPPFHYYKRSDRNFLSPLSILERG